MSLSGDSPGPMRVKDCLLYLFGSADAARRIARSRAALLTGLLLVLTAAIALRYDALYLPASWTWWAGPIVISILSSLLVFGFVCLFLRLPETQPTFRQYTAFLGLFWMTAPCAWLYAIPFEAHLDSLAAAQANLALVALVAVWRVAILTKAVQAVTGAACSLCLTAILFPAALEAAALSFLARLSEATSALAAMGGIRTLDPGDAFLQRAHGTVFWVSLVLLIVLAIAHARIRQKRAHGSSPFPVASHGRALSASSFIALTVFGGWIAVSLPSQTRQRRLHHAESLVDQNEWAGFISYLQTLSPEQLPTPLQLPPGERPWWWSLADLGKILEALPQSAPSWIGEAYREMTSEVIQNLDSRFIQPARAESIAAILTHGDKLPLFGELLDERAPEVRDILSKVCDPADTFQYYNDHSDLLNLYFVDDSVVPIRYPILWEPRRKLILHGMEQAMGPLPKRVGHPLFDPFDPEIVDTVELERCKRLTMRLTAEPGDRIAVYLYLPNSATLDPPSSRLPAVLALHPTNPIGKGVVDGQSEGPNRAYGRELAERGYIVLAPDYPSFGDSTGYDFEADAYVSGTMKGIFNHMRCVDYLVTRPDVDPERLGVIGHSLGGHNAIFAAAFDERLKVAVSSCGWTPFHDYYEGDLAGWTSDRYMPRIRENYLLEPNKVPFDFYECIAAIAPRGFFSNSPIRDENFHVDGVRKAEPVIAKVYELHSAADRFQIRYPDAGHDFPPEVREESYRFIDSMIGPPGKFD